MRVEWDEKKRIMNLEKHGIDFPDAAPIFLDAKKIEWIDNRKDYGETRYRIIGEVNDIVLHIAYTQRRDKKRIISARRANKNEKNTYLLSRQTT